MEGRSEKWILRSIQFYSATNILSQNYLIRPPNPHLAYFGLPCFQFSHSYESRVGIIFIADAVAKIKEKQIRLRMLHRDLRADQLSRSLRLSWLNILKVVLVFIISKSTYGSKRSFWLFSELAVICSLLRQFCLARWKGFSEGKIQLPPKGFFYLLIEICPRFHFSEWNSLRTWSLEGLSLRELRRCSITEFFWMVSVLNSFILSLLLRPDQSLDDADLPWSMSLYSLSEVKSWLMLRIADACNILLYWHYQDMV